MQNSGWADSSVYKQSEVTIGGGWGSAETKEVSSGWTDQNQAHETHLKQTNPQTP
jgi:hypothetical protein